MINITDSVASRNKRCVGGERIEYLDFVAGCMMLVVIFLHAGVLESVPYSIMHVFGFFMPWFFFKAGMFHIEDLSYTRSLFLKLSKRFVIPMCLYLILSRGDSTILWFLEALILSKLVFVALPKSKVFLVLLSLFLFITGDVINRCELSIPLLLKEMPMALFYYTTGFLLKNLKYDSKIIIYLVVAYLLVLFIIPSRVDMRMQTILFGYFEIAVVGCLVGIVLMNALCEKYKNILPSQVMFIGRESMVYYILHMPIIIIVQSVLTKFANTDYNGLISAFVVLFVVPIIIILAERLKLNWILGKP